MTVRPYVLLDYAFTDDHFAGNYLENSQDFNGNPKFFGKCFPWLAMSLLRSYRIPMETICRITTQAGRL